MALTMFSSITLAISTPVQVIAPGTGHYTLYLLNAGTGKLYISSANNPGANATSFMVPAGTYSPALSISGVQPLWISSDAAGTVSAYFAPKR